MSAITSFTICEATACKSFDFNETTGAYDASTNVNGWGSPNEATSDATAATLKVTDPGGTDYTIDLFATGNFPTTDKDVEHTVHETDLGLSDNTSLADGLYTMTYTVTTPSETYTTTKKVLFFCKAKCCTHKMLSKLSVSECSCSSGKIDDALLAYTFLKAIEYAASCGNEKRFDDLLTAINRLCTNNDCNCD